MKNKIYTIFLLGLSLFLLSTCKNPKIGYETFTITDESIKPKTYNAKINGSFSFSGNVHEMKMKIATDELLTNATNYSIIIDNQTFSAEIDGLKPNTTYYYCYSIDFGWKEDYLTEINSFETQDNPNDSLTIVAYCNPQTGGTATGGGVYSYGENCTVRAIANPLYTFVNWTENGTIVSIESDFRFVVTTNHTLVANFTKDYVIKAVADPEEGGNVTGTGIYAEGENCTLTATANTGYVFSHWEEGDLTVSSNTSYTFVVNGNRNLVAKFNQAYPVGAINGRFTINSEGDQVYFSRGNLQYIGSANTPYWKFADKQWDYLGNNGQGSENQQADRDLFGWGTSGWNCGNKFYQPYDTDNSSGEFYGPNNNNDLTGQYANSDWGCYNTISNGGATSGLWRTLTNSEWNYVFFKRNTPSGIRFATANVSGVNGIIILPDAWNSGYNLSAVNNQEATFMSNVISDSEWTNKLEKNGAVFLPVAGWRFGPLVMEDGSKGYYWTSSHHDTIDNTSFSLSIADGAFSTNKNLGRHAGLSVRLVYPIP